MEPQPGGGRRRLHQSTRVIVNFLDREDLLSAGKVDVGG